MPRGSRFWTCRCLLLCAVASSPCRVEGAEDSTPFRLPPLRRQPEASYQLGGPAQGSGPGAPPYGAGGSEGLPALPATPPGPGLTAPRFVVPVGMRRPAGGQSAGDPGAAWAEAFVERAPLAPLHAYHDWPLLKTSGGSGAAAPRGGDDSGRLRRLLPTGVAQPSAPEAPAPPYLGAPLLVPEPAPAPGVPPPPRLPRALPAGHTPAPHVPPPPHVPPTAHVPREAPTPHPGHVPPPSHLPPALEPVRPVQPAAPPVRPAPKRPPAAAHPSPQPPVHLQPVNPAASPVRVPQKFRAALPPPPLRASPGTPGRLVQPPSMADASIALVVGGGKSDRNAIAPASVLGRPIQEADGINERPLNVSSAARTGGPEAAGAGSHGDVTEQQAIETAGEHESQIRPVGMLDTVSPDDLSTSFGASTSNRAALTPRPTATPKAASAAPTSSTPSPPSRISQPPSATPTAGRFTSSSPFATTGLARAPLPGTLEGEHDGSPKGRFVVLSESTSTGLPVETTVVGAVQESLPELLTSTIETSQELAGGGTAAAAGHVGRPAFLSPTTTEMGSTSAAWTTPLEEDANKEQLGAVRRPDSEAVTKITPTLKATTSAAHTITSSSPPSSSWHRGPPLVNFTQVEHDKDWDVSPYVSQERLYRLWQYLFGSYYKDVPPVPSDGGPLPVGVGINFVKFKDFDEVAGTMNIALNLRLCWDDERLSFSAREFFGKSWEHEGDKIPIRSTLIWTPDVTVLNEVAGISRLMQTHSSPLVLSDDAFRNETGVNVLWSRPLDVKSNCEVDMSQYPFDEQRCYIIVGSWATSLRQMLLVPQPFFAEYTVHTSEFRVQNITVEKRDVYTRNTAQMFNEVVYCVVLQRYPHYYVINFILPMVAITLMTVATMWMSPGNVGPRVNSGTKLLLCVVSMIFITARRRPAIHGDIWMDRFQSHCLALAMSSVLESLFIDYLSKTTVKLQWAPQVDNVDAVLRAMICWVTTLMIFTDACQVKRYNALLLYTSFAADSTRLLVLLVYIIFFGLLLSSSCNIVWLVMPRRWQRELLGKDDDDKPKSDSPIGGDGSPVWSTDIPPCKQQVLLRPRLPGNSGGGVELPAKQPWLPSSASGSATGRYSLCPAMETP